MRLATIFDRIIHLLTILAGGILIFMMLAIGVDVVMRYFLNRPIIWVTEIGETSLLFITFLGAAWLLKKEEHVKMDLVLSRLGPRTQVLINIVTSAIGAIIFLVITWYGVKVTWEHFQKGTYQTSLLEIPNAYVLFIIPVGSILLFIQFLRRSYGYLGSWSAPVDKEQNPPRADKGSPKA